MWNTRSITVQFHIGLQLFAYEVYFCLHLNLVLQLQIHVSKAPGDKQSLLCVKSCKAMYNSTIIDLVLYRNHWAMYVSYKCIFQTLCNFSITAHVHVVVFVGIIMDFLTYKSATFNDYNSFYTIERRFLFFKALFLNKSTSIEDNFIKILLIK